jgi:hypothetical protein
MEQPKLERNQHHRINANQADRLYLWESSFGVERENLTLQDHGGNDVLTVFGLTHDQLAHLYLEIAQVLRKSPDPTLHHLKQIHSAIGKLIDTVEPQEETWTRGKKGTSPTDHPE